LFAVSLTEATAMRLAIVGIAVLACVSAAAAAAADAPAATAPDESNLLARINPEKNYFPVLRAQLLLTRKLFFAGEPVLADLLVINTSDSPALLRIPFEPAGGARLTEDNLAGGLPLSHVFSRKPQAEGMRGRRALVIQQTGDPITQLDNEVTYATTAPAAEIVVRPHGVVGRRVDLAKFYPTLTRPGRYNVQWRPYGDALQSDWTEIRVMAEEKAIIETNLGNMELLFLYDKAPDHVDNFLDLARNKFYDGTQFHRVIAGFMIQGGDPLTIDRSKEAQKNYGTGRGPRTLHQEFNDVPFSVGVVGAARGPDVNSASCQFFIVTGNAMHLNGNYTAFARLADEASRKVAQKISTVQTAGNDRPSEPVVVNRIRVVPANAPATTQPEK
jgi:peptidyl-prolyl cis-trans isomerase B (cyclophilin B)